jgi:hypothetical protein
MPQRFACWVMKVLYTHTEILRICNIYCFTTSKLVTLTHQCVTLYVRCLYFPMLRSIAVHIHRVCSVYCVTSLTMCSSALILTFFSSNYSAVWDAVLLQYTCTAFSVRHVHHHTAHTRGRENVFIGTVINYFMEKAGKYCRKSGKQRPRRQKNNYRETQGIRELGWRGLDWGLEMEGIEGLEKYVSAHKQQTRRYRCNFESYVCVFVCLVAWCRQTETTNVSVWCVGLYLPSFSCFSKSSFDLFCLSCHIWIIY